MKKITMLIGSLLIGSLIYAQQPPQGGAGGGAFWRKGGNTGPFGSPNIFGTATGNNNPIYTYTNGIARQKLNANLTYNVNNFAGNRDGYLLLGYSQGYAANLFNSATQGAYSMLHLNGRNGTFVQSSGYRPWMQTGITLTDNDDMSYFGIRKVGNGTDITETVIVWSDNGNNGFPGPDDMVFRFTSVGAGNNAISNDLTDPADLDGFHIARFAGTGEFGLGNTFGTDNPLYIRPASLQHLSLSNMRSVYTQFTNRDIGVGSGTGETNADGLRIGILGHQNNQRNGNALIYNQENRHLLFSTSANTNNVTPNNTQERMRVTRIGAPTNQPNGGYGGYNPANLGADFTRVSISHNPANPVTRPLSLVHLGYNTGGVGFNQNATDGWRPWMDIGTFTSNGTDNVYIGLKQEAGAFPASDRNDAVVNWGDNDGTNPLNGPDNLRFIFTSTQTATIPGNAPGNSLNGLEVARMDPRKASTLSAPNYGMMGIGDFSAGSQNVLLGRPVDAKLDIDGDLRIREIQNDNTLFKVLVADEADLNRVKWRDISTFASGLGNYCNATNNPLTGDYEIDMDGHNIFIDDIGNVNIGDVACGSTQFARLFVRNTNGASGVTTGIWSECAGQPNQTAGYFNGTQYGIFAENPSQGTGMTAAVYAVGSFSSGPSLNQWAGYFDGDVFSTGNYYPSETALKDNVTDISNALATIKKLKSVTFNFKNSSYPSMNLPVGLEYGVIAENVDTVLPDLVKNMTHPAKLDSLGNIIHAAIPFKGVNYTELIPVLIAGVKELDSLNTSKDSIIQNLDNRLQQLEDCLINSGICVGSSSKTNNTPDNEQGEGQTIELSNLNAIILDQNLPNPFAEKTSIAYSIPDDVFEAQLLFYDMSGRIIKQVDITERGDGKLTVYGENLKNGIYTYSLIADGKLIATKKMVKQ